MNNPNPPRKANPRGPKPHSDIEKITKQLGVSKRRAQQLIREASLAAPGDARKYLELRCRRVAQVIEKSEIELARLRAGDGEQISLRAVEAGLRCFLHGVRVSLDLQAERLCLQIGDAWPKHAKEFQRFANSGFYAGAGNLLYLAENPISVIAKELLQAGDQCFPRGPEAAETSRQNARTAALALLAAHAEGPAGTPEQLVAIKTTAKAFGFTIPQEAA